MASDSVSGSARVYKRLVETVINETNCEDLLAYDSNLVDYMSTQVEHLNGLLASNRNLDPFAEQAHKMELQRVTFLLHKYFERRLHKIEANVSYLINVLKSNPDSQTELMSSEEVAYLKRYVQGVDVYMNEVLLQQMPPNMQSFNLGDLREDEVEGHFNYKFVRALKDTSVVVEDPAVGEVVVEMKKDEQYFLPYQALKPHLLTSKNLLLL